MAKKIYKEKQRFRSAEVILLIVFLMGMVGYSFIKAVGEHQWHFTYVEWSCIAFLMILGGFLWYLMQLRFNLAISEKGIHYKMKPFHDKKQCISWDEVSSCEVVKTPRMAQWHGGNITFNHEKRFTVNGRNGLHVTTKDGQEYFLGSRRLNELRKAVENVLMRHHQETIKE